MAECPTCEKQLDTEHGMKIHHQTVHGESLALKTYECEWCGKEFERHKSKTKQSDHIYCSDECEGKRRTHEWEPEQQAGWSGGKHEYECDQCGETVLRYPYKVEQCEHTFCSYSCQGQWVSENKSGSDHWHYRGNDPVQYGQNWTSKREEAIKRDDEQCVDCGMTRQKHHDEYGSDIEVHHIKPVKTFSDVDEAHKLKNLVTVCTQCHHNREHS